MSASAAPKSSFTVRPAAWEHDRAALRKIREVVFIDEQRVPRELEWDGLDEAARHVIAFAADGTPIATGRLLIEHDAERGALGRIGRMAVLREWRGRGVGGALLAALLDIARGFGIAQVHLHAQTHALKFYAVHGFQAKGEEFEEAGIAHREMWRAL